jgi:hypothetical protein
MHHHLHTHPSAPSLSLHPQIHPSFWNPAQVPALALAANGTGTLTNVGREAAILFEGTHTIKNNMDVPPTTMLSNFVVASFRDFRNFGFAACNIGKSNGRAFLVVGDSGIVEVSGFAMNNEKNGDTNLWASGNGSHMALRIRGVVLNYKQQDDLQVAF